MRVLQASGLEKALEETDNQEWLDAVLVLCHAEDGEDKAIDYIYRTLDRAARTDRLNALLQWLDPEKLSTVCVMAVLSITRRPMADFWAMAAGLDPKLITTPALEGYARRAVATLKAREQGRDVRMLLCGMVDGTMLDEETAAPVE